MRTRVSHLEARMRISNFKFEIQDVNALSRTYPAKAWWTAASNVGPS